MATALPNAVAQWVNPYQAQIDALQAQMAQPAAPMFTPEQIAQRRADNQRDYALGVLGQLSGDQGAADIGGSVLKNAVAQRTQRVTDKGTFDPITGETKYSADYLRERDEGRLNQLQQRAAAADAAWQEARQRAGERAELQADKAENQRILRGMMGGGGGASVGDARIWSAEDRMSDDFRQETKTPNIVLGAHRNLQAIAQQPNAASDIAFIFAYMKMLDPTSVVREGEFATAQNAAGVPAQVINAYNRARTGERLNPQQRLEMLGTAGRLAGEAQKAVDQSSTVFRDRAKRRNLNPDNITGPIEQAPVNPAPGPAPAPAAAPAGGGGGWGIRLKGG